MGCGFGLFSLFLASRSSERILYGVDLSASRIQAARTAAERMHLTNVQFERADIRDYAVSGEWDGIFTLDLLHHVLPQSRLEFLKAAKDHLKPEGVLVIKDITTRPRWKMAFTWLLENIEDQTRELEGYGFEVHSRSFKDRLPYPHVVFHCKAKKDP
jgi:cyclopropane fatty-acyl-phospholipid synthase-like methyltransferase